MRLRWCEDSRTLSLSVSSLTLRGGDDDAVVVSAALSSSGPLNPSALTFDSILIFILVIDILKPIVTSVILVMVRGVSMTLLRSIAGAYLRPSVEAVSVTSVDI